MFDNIKAGLSPHLGVHYCYVMPSPGNYPFQWWWDTCINIYILCALGEVAFAQKSFKSLLEMQRKDGFVGHMIFWESLLPTNLLNILQSKPTLKQFRPHTSSLIQPPLVAQALLRIYECSKDKDYLLQMLPKVKKYHDWLAKNRDFDGDGLISIISTFESGLDWKPSFDEVLGFKDNAANEKYFRANILVEFKNFWRGYDLKKIHKANYFIVKEVLVNTMYVLDLQALAQLCDHAGDSSKHKYEERATKAANRMLEIMYDADDAAFYDVHGSSNKKLKVLTFTIALPGLLKDVPKEIATEILTRHLLNKDEFALPYPVPSVAKTEHSFSPYETKFMWRGPTWALTNWLLFHCFKNVGMEKEANKVFQTLRQLIDENGFREYYNPLNGKGYGAKNFTWGGLIVDMMRHEK